ncbi:MAG: hypothetical protein A3C56_01570 [Ignavibacteria bacterium RIFCSPHIGHO2_02_FULL_56_12]|nr:MAG: hypothetical protein A3C56_01570 [Ignavibacteria bacterium RIFCSPHIGHO2_02_FULL_56_12]
MSSSLNIRPATVTDLPLILSFIKKLADYEKLPHQVVATEEILRVSLFGPKPQAECLLAFLDDAPVGFGIFFHNFSTFLGRHCLYLEDLFVVPEKRGHGVGKALLQRLAAIAVERGCGRFEWAVLDWNESAIEFYRSIGATMLDDWRIFRLSGEALQRMAKEEKEK